MCRNEEVSLPRTLNNMASYCDAIYALNDRSTDSTREILERHPTVELVSDMPFLLPEQPWVHFESSMLKVLYDMAETAEPEWTILLNADETVSPADHVRPYLRSLPRNVVGVWYPKRSAWDDAKYPKLVPLMGKAEGRRCDIWRFSPGQQPDTKRLHCQRHPLDLDQAGPFVTTQEIRATHWGWNTLEKRIARVRLYTRLDPTYELNYGVRYDEGLLFGYRETEIESLLEEYRRRYAQVADTGDAEP